MLHVFESAVEIWVVLFSFSCAMARGLGYNQGRNAISNFFHMVTSDCLTAALAASQKLKLKSIGTR